MSDRIAVSRRPDQAVGTPEECTRPGQRVLAGFVGTSNLISAPAEAVIGRPGMYRSAGEDPVDDDLSQPPTTARPSATAPSPTCYAGPTMRYEVSWTPAASSPR